MQEGNRQRLVAGRYAVLGELGRGGIGVVWRAQDEVIGRQVALKELRIPPGLGQQERDTFLQRALREARTAGALNDPAIVTVYDVVSEGGAMFIVMELVEAGTLADLVAQGPLSEQRATELGRQVLSALETAHAAGIVHRDIKPSNIMVLPGDRVKLTDFGIAQAMDDPSLTATGGIMGSPGYMAPELFHGDPPSPATDLWSLGATLFHVVEGRAPFQRDSTAATMHAIMYDDPQLRRCTGPLAGVIMGLLAHDPADRLTVAQVRAGLAAPSDVERTDVMPRIADERTTLLDRDRTTTVTRRPRTTRPWSGDNEAAEFTELVPDRVEAAPADWSEPARKPKRRALLIGAVVVAVLALVGVAFALIRPGSNAVAAPPPARRTTSSAPSATPTATSSAAPTTTAAPTSTTKTTTTTTTHTQTTQAAAPPPPSAPKLTYVALVRYSSTSGNGYDVSLTHGETIPPNYAVDTLVGDLVTTNVAGTEAIYLCQVSGSQTFYFTSRDQTGTCEGWTTIGLEGYIFTSPQPALNTVRIYRCTTTAGNHSKFDSADPNCEGIGHSDGPLGYIVKP